MEEFEKPSLRLQFKKEGWVSVYEKFPDDDNYYYVRMDNGECIVMSYCGDGEENIWESSNNDTDSVITNVTHWRPISLRGGKRKGAGRPKLKPSEKKEATKVMRIPISLIHKVQLLIKRK